MRGNDLNRQIYPYNIIKIRNLIRKSWKLCPIRLKSQLRWIWPLWFDPCTKKFPIPNKIKTDNQSIIHIYAWIKRKRDSLSHSSASEGELAFENCAILIGINRAIGNGFDSRWRSSSNSSGFNEDDSTDETTSATITAGVSGGGISVSYQNLLFDSLTFRAQIVIYKEARWEIIQCCKKLVM